MSASWDAHNSSLQIIGRAQRGENQNYPPPVHFPESTSREETAEEQRGQAEEEEEEEEKRRAGDGQVRDLCLHGKNQLFIWYGFIWFLK